ncbi:Polyphenol oxidase [Lachnellula suecica]|uniref:Polyphenol oxidase n=1 Tax=Lachnellula suecica TaxID=602035 RepID=A0A8T9CIM9_9HELO|nr:Polyphenol oxidase [Lachnellula suecica]
MLSHGLFGLCSVLSILVARTTAAELTAAGLPILDLQRDTEAYYAIIGVQTGRDSDTGYRPARLEIDDLQKDVVAFSLYIQALQAFADADNSDPLSYFQVAGIHGRPYIPWNNFNQVAGAGPGTSAFGGYCIHNSIVFPVWHRPYVALFEQVIAMHAQAIAKTYTGPQATIFQSAADTLRVPYWDWAANSQMPAVVSQQTVHITTPNGDQEVSNPLYSYKFKQALDPNLFPGGGLADSMQTFRSDNANAALAAGNLMDRTWLALTKSKSWNDIATTATSGTSIEGIHNDIHGYVGGTSSYMTFLDWSAFDPIFWLHHANVDRLFAMWQAANPSAFITVPKTNPGTFTIIPGSLDNIATGLTPFTSSQLGQTYNPTSSRYLSYFGYSYPGLNDWNVTAKQLKSNVIQQIYSSYDPNGIFGKRDVHQTSGSTLQLRGGFTPGAKSKEWSIGIAVDKFDVGGDGFFLRFFVSGVPQDPQDWFINDDCLGSIQVMPTPHSGHGPFPVLMEYDELSLIREVAKAGHDPEDVHAVARFLEKNLEWRVQKLDGTVVPTKQVPSLIITVQDEEVTFPTDNTELPTYGKKTLHPDITKGKAGGYVRSRRR